MSIATGIIAAIDLYNHFEERRDAYLEKLEQRRQIAEDLLAQGLISEEDADEYIRTGQLFLPKDPTTARDAYREIWFQLGRDFEKYVHRTLYEQDVNAGYVLYQEPLSTSLGLVIPDWLVLNRDPGMVGDYLYVVECKAGEINRDQARKLIEVAANSSGRTIIYHVPSEGSRIPPILEEEAAAAGVRIIKGVVPGWIPKWWPTNLPRSEF